MAVLVSKGKELRRASKNIDWFDIDDAKFLWKYDFDISHSVVRLCCKDIGALLLFMPH